MGSRRTGRERALQALYQLDQNDKATPADAVEAAWAASDDQPRDDTAHAFATELVAGVREHLAGLDALIEQHSQNWRIDRMQRVDRNVLRLGVFELKHRDDIPRKVTINEAIELAKMFGTEDSAAFINGVLDRIASAVNKA
ncbi:MAG: transcription antitermination factor NusB [Myxococcaceae bacterium]|nr:transcription antitermination factor NusB [Myxococcaceae bacterium]